ncbi:MAG: hypothetical protein ACOY4H_06585 [Thermodesulfobacteriota bacterium]
MKKIVIALLSLALSACPVFAAGGKNHGTTGKGKVITGTISKGQASQNRTGR